MEAIQEVILYIFELIGKLIEYFYKDELYKILIKGLIAGIAILIFIQSDSGTSERTDNQKPKEWYEPKE